MWAAIDSAIFVFCCLYSSSPVFFPLRIVIYTFNLWSVFSNFRIVLLVGSLRRCYLASFDRQFVATLKIFFCPFCAYCMQLCQVCGFRLLSCQRHFATRQKCTAIASIQNLIWIRLTIQLSFSVFCSVLKKQCE